MTAERRAGLRVMPSRSTTGEAVPGVLADLDAPIDRAHLMRYSLGSLALEREVLGLFMAQLPLSIEQLRFATTDREWQIAAHTIKGSARAVGARHVARVAAEAESAPAVLDEVARARILDALEQAGEQVAAYVEEALPPAETLPMGRGA